MNLEPFDVDNTRAERGEFAHAVEDEFLGEDKIYVEDLEDHEMMDHNLDDMIVEGGQEVVDEFAGDMENISTAVDGGPTVDQSMENKKEIIANGAPVGDIVDVGDEVIDKKPQEFNQMEKSIRGPVMVKYVGDAETMEIIDDLINPRAQGRSGRGKAKKRRRRKNW